MSAKENSSVGADRIKLLAALAVFLASIIMFYSFPELNALVRVGVIVIAIVIAGFIALQTDRGQRIWGFAQDARTEVRKVVWPTRAETIQTTLIVIATVIVVALMLWIVDSFLLVPVGYLTGRG